ncbi:GNAT family N-acetyltransferase [Flagellimonas sp. 389]|uniref:GNAT family N-acetyltransferase n=1 Tax=Flagellimonas sp. 389 TaxID=2835862 RepID=UPI001BD1C81C|nr:GNAT family N-acetyltransferase [Flagellimonas sp. 389]MBS9463880.1 GNAT family N-acetyltransferase [Flagellimonas sp. 389]
MESDLYLSEPFISTWITHFNKGAPSISFDFFGPVSFIKHNLLPLYWNTGKTNTKGISYTPSLPKSNEHKGKVFLIYDVHKGVELKKDFKKYRIKRLDSEQYRGYLCELSRHSSLENYMCHAISKKSRYKFRLYRRKLELSFNIHYKMYYGDITENEYEFIFDCFKKLLEKRFLNKRVRNNNLNPKEWSFYKKVTFPMILKKQAALFVVYDEKKPIAITLLNFSKNTAIDVIRTFDIDYAKFRLGTTSLMGQLQWCIAQGFKTLDFSKGHFGYKQRWSTKSYNFEYHIYYDSNSFLASILAHTLYALFNVKQFLRKNNFSEIFHKVAFRMHNRNISKHNETNYYFNESPKKYRQESLLAINLEDNGNPEHRSLFYDFLYRYSERKADAMPYRIMEKPGLFLIKGKKSTVEVVLT